MEENEKSPAESLDDAFNDLRYKVDLILYYQMQIYNKLLGEEFDKTE